MSPIMRQAIVSVEDRRFYEHNGVDTRGILRASCRTSARRRVVEGGSTITQQFVKNAYVRNQKTLARKVREAALAWQLEQRWPKDRILLAYLNTIYFGNGAYGIQQAARTYFDKGAGAPDARRSPRSSRASRQTRRCTTPPSIRAAAKQRRRYVLQTMFDQGKITARQLENASRAPLPKAEDVRLPGTQGPGAVLRQLRQGPADRPVRRRSRLRRWSQGDDARSTSSSRRPRDKAIESVLQDAGRPRRPRSSRSTRARAPCGRWSAARTSARASSTSPPRPSGSRARRSSRSCSRRRSGRASPP